jgi:hypothetical protein
MEPTIENRFDANFDAQVLLEIADKQSLSEAVPLSRNGRPKSQA